MNRKRVFAAKLFLAFLINLGFIAYSQGQVFSIRSNETVIKEEIGYKFQQMPGKVTVNATARG